MALKFDRIYIELSNICNFSCPFCSSAYRKKQCMTLPQVASILTAVKDFTNEVCLHVLGEPLLYEWLGDVFALCKQNGLKINLVTNGYFIKSKLPLILNYSECFKKISFSLHSYRYHTEDITKKLTDIVEAAKEISESGVSVELRNLKGTDDAEFTSTLIKTVQACTGITLTNLVPSQKLQAKLFYVLKALFVWPDQSKSHATRVHNANRVYCLGSKTHIAILSNLTVVPCCLDSAGEIALGNLQSQTLNEVLCAEPFTTLRNLLQNGKPPHPLCKTCHYQEK